MDNQFMICKKCGRRINPGEKFCSVCGPSAMSVQNLQEAAAQEKTVLYLPDEDDLDVRRSAQWDKYSREETDSHRNIVNYTQDAPYPYPQDPGNLSVGGYNDQPPQYFPPERQPGEFDYNKVQTGYYAQQDPYQQDPYQQDSYPQDPFYEQQAQYYPQQAQTYPGAPTSGGRPQISDKARKILVAVLIVTVIALLMDGVFAALYLNDVTSSFFPVKDVIQWIKGEEEKPEPDEGETQAGYMSQDGTPEFTAPAAPIAPETTVSVPENLQPYLGSATAVNGLYYVNTRSGSLNLRKLPGGDSTVLVEIPKQTVVTVQYVYDNWGYLEYRGYSGWASMQFLQSYS